MDWIPVGKLTKPHGLKGELKFRPWITDPEIIEQRDFGFVVRADPRQDPDIELGRQQVIADREHRDLDHMQDQLP